MPRLSLRRSLEQVDTWLAIGYSVAAGILLVSIVRLVAGLG